MTRHWMAEGRGVPDPLTVKKVVQECKKGSDWGSCAKRMRLTALKTVVIRRCMQKPQLILAARKYLWVCYQELHAQITTAHSTETSHKVAATRAISHRPEPRHDGLLRWNGTAKTWKIFLYNQTQNLVIEMTGKFKYKSLCYWCLSCICRPAF